MIIAIDFDGTCVSHEFPKVGKEIGAVPVLLELVKQGHQLILFTMRSDTAEENYLTDAVNWFKDKGIDLYGVQTNPTQYTWTHSPKAYAQLYIDDAALGCPLTYNKHVSKRPFVDWVEVEKMLYKSGVLTL